MFTPIALGNNNFSLVISTNTANFSVSSAITAHGWNGIEPVNVVVTINPSVAVYSTSTSTPAFDVTLPANSFVILNIGTGAVIAGAGGRGGNYGSNGYNGGPGLHTNVRTTINNLGTIGGGGGGGGGGGNSTDGSFNGGAGGGGGGAGYGAGGLADPGSNGACTNGSTGGLTTGGAAGSGGVSPGPGGNLGAAGGGGCGAHWTGSYTYAAGCGGSPGYSIQGWSNITWQTVGTISGTYV